ncbi:MAG TPA: tetratricopeptide repeat protein, partial [Phycisphaerales bacterium]|nr:tetratricopeptide repeat protein [Phycisphaerales bacterium]
RPDAFLPDLAMSLNNVGNRLSELGRREEALAAAEEGVGLMLSTLRFLPPAVVVPRVIKSLQNLLRIAEEAQRNPAELPAVVAAIQVLQQLGVVPRQPEG